MSDSPTRLYKFGKTSSDDIMERFDLETHRLRKWRNTPLAQDYEVKPLWSAWVTKEEAKEAEEWFETNYPKTFYSTSQYNGIKECRDWKPAESYKFFEVLEKRYPKVAGYWEKIEELKANKTISKTHSKIYFVMLTKK